MNEEEITRYDEKILFEELSKDKLRRSNILINLNVSLQNIQRITANIKDFRELQEYKIAVVSVENELHEIEKENKKLKEKLQKYKSLYENEKDHTDTLKRIIKEVKEYLERHLTARSYITARSYSNHKYELFGREYLEEILDLLKEIK